MNSLDKLNELANNFEKKLNKIAQEVTQVGTPELFFGSASNMISFGDAIRNQNGPVFKILNDFATNKGKSTSLDLKVKAEPGKGAAWLLSVSPPELKRSVINALDSEFKKIMNVSMAAQNKEANEAAKRGAGSGQLDTVMIALDM